MRFPLQSTSLSQSPSPSRHLFELEQQLPPPVPLWHPVPGLIVVVLTGLIVVVVVVVLGPIAEDEYKRLFYICFLFVVDMTFYVTYD